MYFFFFIRPSFLRLPNRLDHFARIARAVEHWPTQRVSNQIGLTGSIASARSFDGSRWRACLRLLRFPGAGQTKEVRKGKEWSGFSNSSFAKRLMDSTRRD